MAQQGLSSAQRLFDPFLLCDVAAGPAVSEKGAIGVEHRVAADRDDLPRAAGMGGRIGEIAEGTMCFQVGDVLFPDRVLDVDNQLETRFSDKVILLETKDFSIVFSKMDEAKLGIHLPNPVGRSLDDILEAALAGAQLELEPFLLGEV